MATVWIVPALDEIEDRPARLGWGREPAAIEQLTFEGREETLAQRIVEGVANRAHRRADARRLAPQAERDRGALTAVVGMMDDCNRARSVAAFGFPSSSVIDEGQAGGQSLG